MASGDHIYAWRHGFLYEHHGIDCGNGTVIENQGPDEPRVIRQITLEAFSNGAVIRVVQYNDSECFSPNEVVKRAEQFLGKSEYNLIFNNCERFAIWCKTGKDKPGDQVENVANTLGEALGNILFNPE